MRRTNLETNKGFGLTVKIMPGKGLSGRFIFPPFTVLRTFDKEWQRRKRQWLRLGIESETGRGDELLHKGKTLDTKSGEKWSSGGPLWQNSGTSIFDPVLCELMYSWFCPKGGQVVDPFAGGSVRAIVAAYLGLTYWGCELRAEQVAANVVQGEKLTPENPPVWVCGDAGRELRGAPAADFVFSCPPYGNLEVYSDLEGDISNIEKYDDFVIAYSRIIKRACLRLKENRFACFVVSNYRDKGGFYNDFIGDTVRAFERGGCHYYNEAVLVTAIGSLPIRTGKIFSRVRKMGKAHQNVLIFYKGNPAAIKEVFDDE